MNKEIAEKLLKFESYEDQAGDRTEFPIAIPSKDYDFTLVCGTDSILNYKVLKVENINDAEFGKIEIIELSYDVVEFEDFKINETYKNEKEFIISIENGSFIIRANDRCAQYIGFTDKFGKHQGKELNLISLRIKSQLSFFREKYDFDLKAFLEKTLKLQLK